MTSVYEDPTTWRLQTGGTGVPYRIVAMSGSFDVENADAQMSVLIPSNKLIQFATEMFPAAVMGSGFPVYPSNGKIYGTPLYAHKISWRGHVDGLPVDPFGVDPGAPPDTYQKVCECSIDFKTMNEQDTSDQNNPETFLEVSCTGGGHFITSSSPKASWWLDENNPITFNPTTMELPTVEPDIPMGMSVPTVDWDISWPRVPYTYYSATLVAKIRAALGKVNSTTMPLFFNAPRGTILFVGYSMRRNFSWRAGSTWQSPFNLNLKFQEKRIVDDGGVVRGHNDFWRPGFGWRFLKHKDGTPVYRYSNLNAIYSL